MEGYFMSTKIYDGYKIKTKDIDVVFDLIISTGKKCQEWAEKDYKDQIICSCIRKLDAIQFNPEEKPIELDKYQTSLYGNVAYAFDTAIRTTKKSSYRNPPFDYVVEFAVIPLKNKDYCLCILYGEKKEYSKILLESSLVEFYGYWDNSDKDEDCTDEEWEQRASDWDILGYEPVCKTSFGYKVMDDYTFPPLLPACELRQVDVDNINGSDLRAEHIFNSFFGFKHFKNITTVESNMEVAETFDSYYKYVDWLKTDDGIRYKFCEIEKIKNKLKWYTVEDLTKNIKEIQ
jgi:hypothetical protein